MGYILFLSFRFFFKSIRMKLSILSVLFVLSPLFANAATIEARGTASHIETKDEYERASAYMKGAGECRAYINHKKNGLFTCDGLCQPPPETERTKGVVKSTSCIYLSNKGNQDIFTDPDKQQYHIGKCECNVKILDYTMGTVVLALPDIAAITCMAWIKAGEELFRVAKAATGLIPVPAAKGLSLTAKLAVKAAKDVKKAGKQKEDYPGWYKGCTQPGRHDYASEASQAFDDAMKVPNEIMDIFG
ncbi:hypothetical protein BGZ60DRAFT_549240 [Tricladium varicosporioides]|nr:hypothetical protein BGZ60DRAFT_549240 [Hymenoscyphus varicosporioides]